MLVRLIRFVLVVRLGTVAMVRSAMRALAATCAVRVDNHVEKRSQRTTGEKRQTKKRRRDPRSESSEEPSLQPNGRHAGQLSAMT
jgi:hypothetical protein